MRIRVVGLSVLGASLIVAGGLALFAFDFPHVGSNEMAPGLRANDLLLACRVCGAPQRGDVVVFEPPDGNGPSLSLRRVVAGPGDTVEVRHGQVMVNGHPLAAEKVGVETMTGIGSGDAVGRPFERWQESAGAHRYAVLRDTRVVLSGDRPPQQLEDEYFLLADRRTLVKDSRDYGPVSRMRIRSIVKRVLSAGNGEAERQTRLP